MEYDHKKIEGKWQEAWEAAGMYTTSGDSNKPKMFVLDMYPYPSGAGLHVGHVEGYTATDIYTRFMRMQGNDVLHPMGWDAFGLPAENYAVKTGVPPQKTTADAVENFRRQIKALGLSYDWSREVGSHTPEYYKWTQWFFLLLFKNGYAEKKKAKVNWCSSCQTVLANEQVVDGKCERCGTEVVQKDLEQWFFKITEFADALADDLDSIDWPESTRAAQRNWIGRSEGAEVDFKISGGDEKITVFTTRPDTLFGATYLVLAPEHPLVETLLARVGNRADVEAYVSATRKKTDLERQEDAKEKTGVVLSGITAINPAHGEEIPIWIADYVIGTYGTGAIMAVPAHDERDFEFAQKMHISIREVVAGEGALPRITPGTLINSGSFDGFDSETAKGAITQKVGGRMKTTYRLRDWLVSRQRYWGAPIPIVYDPEGKPHPIPEEHLPWVLPTDVEFKPTGVSPLSLSQELKERTERIFGSGWTPEVDTMDTFVCSSWYFFRFTDPHNEAMFADRNEVERWLPVDLYVGGAEHTVLHLLYSRFFTKVLQKLGYISFGEPFHKLRHQGIILAEDGRKMSKSLGNVVNPDDVIELYGADTLRLYEMFMGPLEIMKPWSTQNIIGARRFLERAWRLMEKVGDIAPEKTERELHKTIKKVGEDIAELKFNTAISQMMIFVNTAEEHGISPAQYATFLVLLAPFAPHITEELWAKLGNTESVHLSPWPHFDEAKLVSDTTTIAIQINGKFRATIDVPSGISDDDLKEKAKEAAGKWIQGEIKKGIIVPGRLVNFVVV